MCKLSIIIVSYNTADLLEACLGSIASASWDLPYEVIVVDNDSSDDSVKRTESKFPDTRIIKNTFNAKFAKANNQGADLAKGEYLLLLNSDTLVDGNNVAKLVHFMEGLPQRVVCVGPKILNSDGSLQSQGYPLSGVFERIAVNFHLYKLLPDILTRILLPFGLPLKKEKPRKVGWVSGACMLMRATGYRDLGGLNETMDFYGEEPEFGHRSYLRGYETWYYPFAQITHLGGGSTDKKQKDIDLAHKRYAALQRETVGFKRSIWMSRIVLWANQIKFLLTRNRYFKDAANYEKGVIQYLKQQRDNELFHSR